MALLGESLSRFSRLVVAYRLLNLDRLDGDEVNRHKLRGSWTLHFAAKETLDL